MSEWDQVEIREDAAERVKKYVFTKPDAVAEAVLYRYPDYRTRTVICCSTQSGCPVGCRFCGAGDAFVRSLTPEEIVAQVERCLADVDCDPAEMGRLQIMFMSMGEPLLNLKALAKAIARLSDLYPEAALLISTSGPKADYELLRDVSVLFPKVGLQFSVHETTNEARDRLIPFEHKLDLVGISMEGERWAQATGRRPFFNYCAHEGNTSDLDVANLLLLFPPNIWCATVSVICERNDGLPATNDHQRSLATDFGSRLLAEGYDVRVFDPAGQDTIGGGCGQLWFVQDWLKEHGDRARPSCGAGLPEVHAPTEATA